MTNQRFIATVYAYYHRHARSLPWRDLASLPVKERGYRVVVSEYMLQQTQVPRVIPKFLSWIEKWPTLNSFIGASVSDVIIEWNGLGYNRRAMYLHETLHEVERLYKGIVPNDQASLKAFRGIGDNTAAAIIAYTYNLPSVFIETNIRTAYIHAFFRNHEEKVSDAVILQKVQATLDTTQPRQWYYALMDYGTFVKQQYGNHLNMALQHKRQSNFYGSRRQLRGSIVRILTQKQVMTIDELEALINDPRTLNVIDDLCRDGLLSAKDVVLSLPIS